MKVYIRLLGVVKNYILQNGIFSYREECAVRLIQATRNRETVLLLSISTGNRNQSETLIRWIYSIGLENSNVLLARVWFTVAMTSDRLAFALESSKILCSLYPGRIVCVRVGHVINRNRRGRGKKPSDEVAGCDDGVSKFPIQSFLLSMSTYSQFAFCFAN